MWYMEPHMFDSEWIYRHIIFFRGCVPEMFVTSYFVTYCIYVLGKPGICFHYYCAVYDECKYSDTFGLQIVLVCLYSTQSHYHHCANLSEGIELIKCLSRYILSSVLVWLSIFSPLSIIQYVGLYVFSLPISLVMIVRIYIFCLIIIIKSEVWTITHCLGLGHETMVSAVCLSIFLFLFSFLYNICRTNRTTRAISQNKSVCYYSAIFISVVTDVMELSLHLPERPKLYNISHKICIQFRHVLFYCAYIIVA